MKTIADTNGFRIQCECGEQTQTYTRIGAAREAYREHRGLEHLKPHVRVNVYGQHYAIVCKCGHETNMYKNSADTYREYTQHTKEEHEELKRTLQRIELHEKAHDMLNKPTRLTSGYLKTGER